MLNVAFAFARKRYKARNKSRLKSNIKEREKKRKKSENVSFVSIFVIAQKSARYDLTRAFSSRTLDAVHNIPGRAIAPGKHRTVNVRSLGFTAVNYPRQ